MKYLALSLVALLLVVVLATEARASPHPNPFSYPYETLAAGGLEIEQYADLIPVRVQRENPDGTLDSVFSMHSILQTEVEYGITDRIEVGFYFQFQQAASADPVLQLDGVKQRVRVRLAEQGEWPVDVGLYFEVAELHDEFELEEKILLAKRFGNLNLVANLWVEQEWGYQSKELELLYNPTLGASYQVNPKLFLGLEYWARGHFGEEEEGEVGNDTSAGTHHFLGPTFLAQSGKVFFAVGAYLRLDHLNDSLTVGDPNGRVWVRTLLGIEL